MIQYLARELAFLDLVGLAQNLFFSGRNGSGLCRYSRLAFLRVILGLRRQLVCIVIMSFE